MSISKDTNIPIKIILSLLSVIIITCIISLVFTNNNTNREGFEDIGQIIKDKWNNFLFRMGRFSSIINEDFDKVFGSIGTNIANGFSFLGANVEITGNYFECGITKLENFGDCIIFYIIDIICDIIYSLIYIVFAIIGQTWILDKIIEYLKKFDCFIYDIMGFHVFQYPQTVLDHCYLCPKITNSDNEYSGFIPPPPPDSPELEDPFDELVQAFQ